MNPSDSSFRRYPQPREMGGRLIRLLVQELGQDQGVKNASHILCAVSGGSDSTALALLLARYGRRIASRDRMTWIHVNHGWRGAESDADQEWVEAMALQEGVACRSFRLESSTAAGQSPENAARNARLRIFEQMSAELGGPVLTAHQADDLAETRLWRLFTGAEDTHGAGILRETGVQIRPLLSVRKRDLQAFLEEEKQPWREDRGNHESDLMRARMRRELMPAIERIFPRAVSHLVAEPREPQSAAPELGLLQGVLEAQGVKLRRTHWLSAARSGQASLPQGWRLSATANGWNLTRET